MFLESFLNNPYLIGAIVLFALAIVVVILLVYKVSHNSYFKNIPSSFGLNIYAYLDKKGNLINFTSKFYERLNISSTKEWADEVSSITIDNKQLSLKEFIDYLKKDNFSTNVDFDCDGVKVSISLEKKAIEDEDKIYGYVVFGNTKQNDDSKIDSIYDTIKDVYMPMAIYSGDLNNAKLILNESLRLKLGNQSPYLKYSDLKDYVFEEDLDNFTNAISSNENKIATFRLKTNMGLEMFEMAKKYHDGKVTVVLSLLQKNTEKLYKKSEDLVQEIKDAIFENSDFGGVMLSLSSLINDEQTKNESSFLKELVNKYIRTIRKELLEEKDVIIKVNDYEFVILVKDINNFNNIISNVYNGVSILLYYHMDFGNKDIEIKNKVGLVYSSEMIKDEKDFINALNVSLALANEEGYEKDYSIYSPKKESVETVDYSFEKIKSLVDLDNSFLKDDD